MTRRTVSIVAGVVLAVLIALAFGFCRPKPTPIPRPEQKTIDSLDATKPAHQALVDSLQRVGSAATKEAERLAGQAARIAQDATKARRTADSLRRVANASEQRAQAATDSAQALVAWRQTAQTFKAEADQLRSANDSLQTATDSLRLAYAKDSTARVAAELRAITLGTRLVASEDLNGRLTKDLAKSQPPCGWLLFRCPSRKVVAVLAIAADEGARALYRNRTQLKRLTGGAP